MAVIEENIFNKALHVETSCLNKSIVENVVSSSRRFGLIKFFSNIIQKETKSFLP